MRVDFIALNAGSKNQKSFFSFGVDGVQWPRGDGSWFLPLATFMRMDSMSKNMTKPKAAVENQSSWPPLAQGSD